MKELEILAQLLNKANLNGSFTLSESTMANNALANLDVTLSKQSSQIEALEKENKEFQLREGSAKDSPVMDLKKDKPNK